MKILFVCSSLTSGGAERVITILANQFSKRSHTVYLATHSNIEEDFYEVEEVVKRVEICALSKTKGINKVFQNVFAISRLRKELKSIRPDIVVSFLYQVNVRTILASRFLDIPVIISERNNPEKQGIEWSWRLLRKNLYCYADLIVVQTNKIQDVVSEISKSVPIEVVPNPLPDYSHEMNGSIPEDMKLPDFVERNVIVALGSLTHQKGFDMLIQIFSAIASKYSEWDLLILGEGQERDNLENMVRNEKLDNRVFMPGRVENPFSLMKKSKIFSFTSRWEGFPNALLEALSIGMPVVSFNCETGPSEIISDSDNGFLIPCFNLGEYADRLELLINNPKQRENLSDSAIDSSKRYDLKTVLRNWEAIFKKVIL